MLNSFHNCSPAFPQTPPGCFIMETRNVRAVGFRDQRQHPNFTDTEIQSQRRKTMFKYTKRYLPALFFYKGLVWCYFYEPRVLVIRCACQHIQAIVIPSTLEMFAFCLFCCYFSCYLPQETMTFLPLRMLEAVVHV